jgi:hypothetical protein
MRYDGIIPTYKSPISINGLYDQLFIILTPMHQIIQYHNDPMHEMI